MVKKEACTKCCEGCQNNDGGVAKRCEFFGAVRGAVTLFLGWVFGCCYSTSHALVFFVVFLGRVVVLLGGPGS